MSISHLIEPLLQRLKRAGDAPQFNESPDDLDVHRDGPIAAKNSREHRHALLGEDQGALAPTAVPAA
ncbi:MAG TPA: hypothetical protein VHB23_16760 [Devosiaceae bacterium]|nr:hypothetical protein [Devosiaceae bacterium]